MSPQFAEAAANLRDAGRLRDGQVITGPSLKRAERVSRRNLKKQIL